MPRRTYELEAVLNASTDRINNVLIYHLVSLSMLIPVYYLFYPYLSETISQLSSMSPGAAAALQILAALLPVIAVALGVLAARGYPPGMLKNVFMARAANENMIYVAVIGVTLSVISLAPPGLFIDRLYSPPINMAGVLLAAAGIILYFTTAIIPLQVTIRVAQISGEEAEALEKLGGEEAYKIPLPELVEKKEVEVAAGESLIITLTGSPYYVKKTRITGRGINVKTIEAGDAARHIIVTPTRDAAEASIMLPRLSGEKELLRFRIKASMPRAVEKPVEEKREKGIPVTIHVAVSPKTKRRIETLYYPSRGDFASFLAKIYTEETGKPVENPDHLTVYRGGEKISDPRSHIPAPGDVYEVYYREEKKEKPRAAAKPRILMVERKEPPRKIRATQRPVPEKRAAAAAAEAEHAAAEKKMIPAPAPPIREDPLTRIKRLIDEYRELQGDLW